ncbi:MAG: hypothetical protein ACI9K2_003523, partial [Myxococcota bacterium]
MAACTRPGAHVAACAVLVAAAVAVEAATVMRRDDVAWLAGDVWHVGPWLVGWPLVGAVVVALLALSARAGRAGPWVIGLAWAIPVGVALVPVAGPGAGGWVDDSTTGAWIVLAAAGLVGVLRHHAVWPATAAVALAVGLGPAPDVPTPAHPGGARSAEAPLVLLTLDTFRADHVGALGGPVPTPNLDALAARGRFFTEGVAPAPVTGPAHAGLLTGRPPHTLPMLQNGNVLPDDVVTVASRLADAGYRTGAFVSSGVLDRRVELSRGFAHYDDRLCGYQHVARRAPWTTLAALGWPEPTCGQREGFATISRALDWLDTVDDAPAFLWVHLYDAHSPRTSVRDPGAPQYVSADWTGWRDENLPSRHPSMPAGFAPRQGAAGYAAEIARVDALVGQLVRSLPADTRYVVASDHGESLGEHGYVLNHGRHVFQATLRVPLWVVAPGVAPAQIDTPTASWRVGQTLLALAGLSAEPSLLDAALDDDPIVSFTTGQEARPTLGLGPKRAELALRRGGSKEVVSERRAWSF